MKKKLNIFLLLFVCGLWGTVIFKYVSQYFVQNEISNLNKKELTLTDLKIREKDTFQIIPLNRDPFLNKNFSSDIQTSKVVVQKTTTLVTPQLPKKLSVIVPFPIISYLGYIKSKDKSYEMALLKVNDKFLKLKINETKDNLKIITLTKDSIKIKFFNEVKNFSLKSTK